MLVLGYNLVREILVEKKPGLLRKLNVFSNYINVKYVPGLVLGRHKQWRRYPVLGVTDGTRAFIQNLCQCTRKLKKLLQAARKLTI